MTDVRTHFVFTKTNIRYSPHGDHRLSTFEEITQSEVCEHIRHTIRVFRFGREVPAAAHWRGFLLVAYGAHKQQTGIVDQIRANWRSCATKAVSCVSSSHPLSACSCMFTEV